MTILDVNLPAATYAVTIEPGVLRELGRIVHAVAPHRRAALIVDESVVATHGVVARDALAAAGYALLEHPVTAEEGAKTLASVGGIYDAMLAARCERGTPVVAVGGGIVGDVAGFAAATFLRGVPLVQVPTTLLAMVDASIGGKTGVNHPLPGGAGTGKNLIGAFWQPAAVVADPEVLATLDPRHLRCGLAECVKHALLADAGLLRLIAETADAVVAADPVAAAALVTRSAAVKVAIVARDERETGRRALLNLGHTFGHAIESIAELGLFHGEAVSIGLCAAAHAAVRTRRFAAARADDVEVLLRSLGLPVRLSAPVAIDTLLEAMRFDKKVAGDRLRLVLPTDDGTAVLVDDVPLDDVIASWVHVGAKA